MSVSHKFWLIVTCPAWKFIFFGQLHTKCQFLWNNLTGVWGRCSFALNSKSWKKAHCMTVCNLCKSVEFTACHEWINVWIRTALWAWITVGLLLLRKLIAVVYFCDFECSLGMLHNYQCHAEQPVGRWNFDLPKFSLFFTMFTMHPYQFCTKNTKFC